MYLVLLETSGNQNYIFATNKLRENIGASELTFRSGSTWVMDAIGDLTENPQLKNCNTSQALRNILLDPTHNPPIEQTSTRFEVIIATSGKALVLTQAERDARTLIQNVTLRALQDAPGLEITGVYEPFDWHRHVLGDVNGNVHKHHINARSRKPSADLRFLRLPVVAPCATSGLPAAVLLCNPETNNRDILASATSNAKQKLGTQGRNRIEQLLGTQNQEEFAEDVNDLEQTGEINWLAVIHADGNGLGEIFLKFHHHLETTTPAQNRDYINALRRFSIALDQCTENAFLAALVKLRRFQRNTKPTLIPLVPLILGGDDLTVVCEGETALEFTVEFLRAFEQQTACTKLEEGIIPQLAQKALNVPRLSACAGIAIVKPHFPFSVAYELAEALMKVAKEVKVKIQHPGQRTPFPCSALDFHVLYDASDVQLSQIRQKLQPQKSEPVYLYNRPFIITPLELLEDAGQTALDWATFHSWDNLLHQVQILTAADPNEPERRLLPNSQAHALRQELFRGKDAANGFYQLICNRYATAGIQELGTADDPDSLFALEPATEPATETWVTALIDAIDAANFLHTVVP
jgi:hypothetical protein